mmetsp:Transcript_72535/g.235638  ORF Transcript_72535/g.235638 Transcript_72535/m.235638 type:complete len:220 (-) Transcript_72535:772-1431(-)
MRQTCGRGPQCSDAPPALRAAAVHKVRQRQRRCDGGGGGASAAPHAFVGLVGSSPRPLAGPMCARPPNGLAVHPHLVALDEQHLLRGVAEHLRAGFGQGGPGPRVALPPHQWLCVEVPWELLQREQRYGPPGAGRPRGVRGRALTLGQALCRGHEGSEHLRVRHQEAGLGHPRGGFADQGVEGRQCSWHCRGQRWKSHLHTRGRPGQRGHCGTVGCLHV